jgi:hypothetical protein
MGKKATRGIHRLTPIEVRAAKDDCNDGGGLLLRVTADGNAAWALRFTSPTGKRREMGLGQCHRQSQALAGESLTAARKLAGDARTLLDRGIDPLDQRDTKRAEAQAAAQPTKEDAVLRRDVEHWTLARCACDYHERVIEPKLTAKHSAQWIASLENHVPDALWHAPIATVAAPHIVAALLKMKPHKRARHFGGASSARRAAASSSGWPRCGMTPSFTAEPCRTWRAVPRGARWPRVPRSAAAAPMPPCPTPKRRPRCAPFKKPKAQPHVHSNLQCCALPARRKCSARSGPRSTSSRALGACRPNA